VQLRETARPTRTQLRLGVASALCYAVGYPLALVADSPWGWLLVTLGGVLLAALVVVTVRRIDRSSRSLAADEPGAAPSSSPSP
jgi:type VI protein secretion system component VasK